jgi:hypothetical protein
VTRAERLFAALLPAGFGLLAVALGKDDNWDLLHYHFYNPHAFLHGRFGLDLLAADFHVFFNPLLDLPFYWANALLPAAVITFLLGALHGLNGIAIWRIARHALPEGGVLPAVTMLIGMLGAGSFYVMGTTYYDALVALPVFCGLWLIARSGLAAFEGPLSRTLPLLLLAGVLAGTGVGLKQTVAVFVGGIGLGILLLPGRRLWHASAFGAGIVLGVLITSGFWLLHLWQTTGNPLFPYFNDWFRSLLAPIGNNRTRHAMPQGMLETAAWPFVFTRAPWRIDSPVRDPKLMVAYVVVPLGIVAALWRGRWRDPAERLGLLLLVACAASYVAWLQLFSIYRYLIPVEMLVPLLLVISVRMWGLAPRMQRIATIALLLVVVPIQPSNRDRIPWNGAQFAPFVQAASPVGMDLTGALVVVPGWHPGYRPNAFVIPFFPPAVGFLRIIAHDDPAGLLVTGFEDAIARRIASHDGPVFVLMTPGGEEPVSASLARHRLVADFRQCGRLTTSIGGPLALCPVRRG